MAWSWLNQIPRWIGTKRISDIKLIRDYGNKLIRLSPNSTKQMTSGKWSNCHYRVFFVAADQHQRGCRVWLRGSKIKMGRRNSACMQAGVGFLGFSVMGFLVIMVGLFGNTQYDISRETFSVWWDFWVPPNFCDVIWAR